MKKLSMLFSNSLQAAFREDPSLERSAGMEEALNLVNAILLHRFSRFAFRRNPKYTGIGGSVAQSLSELLGTGQAGDELSRILYICERMVVAIDANVNKNIAVEIGFFTKRDRDNGNKKARYHICVLFSSDDGNIIDIQSRSIFCCNLE